MQNSAWPLNSGEKVLHKGDVRTLSLTNPVTIQELNKTDIMHKWVLVREPRNGMSPIWVSTTNDEYESSYKVRWYPNCPSESQAHEIYCLLRDNWDYYKSVLPHIEEQLWFDYSSWGRPVGYDFCIQMSGTGYGISETQQRHRYLLQIRDEKNLIWLEKEPQGIYTITAASDAVRADMSVLNLFDGDPNTKWKTRDRVYSKNNDEYCWLLEFMTAEPINPTAYYMTTCDDTEQDQNYKYNPRRWNIYAKKNMEDPWILIDARDNTDYPRDAMENKNFWTGWWEVSVGKEMYQYFRLEMYDNADKYENYCFQISEFGFKYNENVAIDENEVYYSVLEASDGYSGNLAPNLFDGNLDTKWCVDKGNKSGTPLHDGKCWYVEFKASKPITPAGFYMTTASDHTVFPDRAPRKWNIYGLKDGWWTLIASYDNTETSLFQMTNADKWTGHWVINGMKGEYQIFRLEMYENWGADCFQISELGFYF